MNTNKTKKEKAYNVILIGGNHHNGLGLVRSFGLHDIRPHGIIIGPNSHKSFLRFSKYWKKLWFATDEIEALNILTHQTFLEKAVLIPYSDGAARVVDLNLNTLSKHYICPSINSKQGEIARLMDKLEQTKLAKKLGLKMLPSQTIQINEPHILLNFPLIIKPVISAEGKKSDIRICHTQEDLTNALQLYRQHNYQRALVQYFLAKRTEYVLTGALFDNTISFTIVQQIRQWPVGRGSGSFSKFCIEPNVVNYVANVLHTLLNLGYRGPIDIEFFKDDSNCFFLNEINWRSSGRNFVCLYNNVHSAYQYYCSCVGLALPNEPLRNTKEGYSMNEVIDLYHLQKLNIGLCQWNKDRRRTQSFTLWYWKDLMPALYVYFNLFKQVIKKGFKNK